PRAAHRRDWHAIGVERGQGHLVVRDAIRSGHADRGEDRHDHAPGDEGAAVVDERIADRDDPALARQSELDVVPLVALLCDRQEMLTARLDEPDRASERARQQRNQDVLGLDDRLWAEAAADVLDYIAYGVLGQREIAREQPAQDLWRLRRRPHGDLTQIAVPARRDRARLHGHAGAAMQMEALAQHDRRPRELAGRIADLLGE